jgi:DNA-binding GntR family transcriptional regulator
MADGTMCHVPTIAWRRGVVTYTCAIAHSRWHSFCKAFSSDVQLSVHGGQEQSGMTKSVSTRETLTDLIVFSLTEDIVANRLAPGHALDEGRIGLRFGASRTPVREAFRQLAAGGLVQLRPHRTPLVAHVDEVRLREMFEVMADLEANCAARASQAMTSAERSKLQAQHAELGAAMRAGHVMQYRAGNMAFHALIYDGAHNAYLAELARSTRERLAPYRGAQLDGPERLAQSYREHEAILTAILRGQSQQAAALMRDHLGNTRAQLVRMTPMTASGI